MPVPRLRFVAVLAVLALVTTACGDDTTRPTASDVTTVVIQPATVSLESLGATQQLSAEGRTSGGETVSDLDFEWSSSNGGVASVSSSGLVTAVGPGTATITARVQGGSASGTAQVAVQQVAEALTVSPTEAELAIGESVDLQVSATDAGGATIEDPAVQWTSSDEAVAVVDDDGRVTGTGAGEATITAASGNASADAAITVIRPDLEIEEDVVLSGEVTVDDVTIAEGATVTVADDLVLRAAGTVVVRGDVRGDCVVVDIQGDGNVDVTGEVDNRCSDATAEGRVLRIAGNGEVNIENATIRSSGDIEMTNDPALTDEDFPDEEPTFGPLRSPLQVDGVPFRIIGSTVVFGRGQTDAGRADDGTDGVDGTDGEDGRDITVRVRGNAVLGGNVTMRGEDGGHGGDGNETAANDITVNGGNGGDGGDLKFFATGEIQVSGTDNVMASGSGGTGGNATGTTTPRASGSSAPSVTTNGGAGGGIGLLAMRAGGGILVGGSGAAPALIFEVGIPGPGGDATSTAADGNDATANQAAQDGGDADARAGEGGGTPDRQLLKRGNVAGSVTLRGEGGASVDGGKGGEAKATAGNGGDGNAAFPPGGDGGDMEVQGGEGGNAQLRDLDGNDVGVPGMGGMATFMAGNGGVGWNDCQDPENPVAGGAGGDGGSITGSDGRGGQDSRGNRAQAGNVLIQDVGNGGDGGDGEPIGPGGDKGTDGVSASAHGTVTMQGTNFTEGDDGDPCPEVGEEEEVAFLLDFDEIPPAAGQVAAGVYTVPLLDKESGEQVGSAELELEGTGFKGQSPTRIGLTDGSWRLNLAALELINVAAYTILATELCFINTSGVSADNPILLQYLTVSLAVLVTVAIADAAANGGCFAITPESAPAFVAVVASAAIVLDVLSWEVRARVQRPASVR